MSWTEERVELLKKYWAEGLSASQIANELGGVTRNAVIGKVHRLGLAARAKSTRSSSTPRPRKPRSNTGAPRRTTAKPRFVGNAALKTDTIGQPEEEFEPAPLRVVHKELYFPPEERATILTLTETRCRWPVGDPTHADFFFCGRQCDADKPYCDDCASLAFQPSSDRRKRASSR